MAIPRKIARLTPALTRQAVNCVAEAFSSRDDAFTRALNLSHEHWAAMATCFIERAAFSDNALSVVAITPEGRVDGVMVNEDVLLATPATYRSALSDDWRPVRQMFRELHTKFREDYAPTPGQIMQCLYFTSVRPEARGQGVMKALWAGTIDAARDNGFSHVVAAASREDVRDVLGEHLGFSELASVPFDSYSFGGKRPFAGLPQADPAQFSRLSLHRRKVSTGRPQHSARGAASHLH